MKRIYSKLMISIMMPALLLLTSVPTLASSPFEDVYWEEVALPIPYPLCDPERLLGPDPVAWRVGITKITPAMKEFYRFIFNAFEIEPTPQPWLENDYCVVIY